MADIERISVGRGVSVTRVCDGRFKQSLISVNFLLPLRRETAAVNALLPMVLRRGCEDFPDMTALNARLKELYGARLDAGVVKRGEIQIVTVTCAMLNGALALAGEDMLGECAKLLRAVLFRPVLENGLFKESEIAIERRNLVDLIDSQLNDKRVYASRRLKEEMCREEAYGVSEYGERGDVDGITAERLTEAWEKMLRSAPVEIFVIGDAGSDACGKLFGGAFAETGRGEIVPCATKVVRRAGALREVEERLPVAQAKLAIGFRAGVATPDPEVPAMQLASTVLGGSPNSKLFKIVREKMSLCYYCWSRFDRQKGLVLIESGIEEQNFEKARDAIFAQLADVQNGDFTDEDLQTAALSLRNSYRELSDTLSDLNAWYLGQAVTGKIRTPAEAAKEVETLTRGEVIAAAKKIGADTVYLLAGEKTADAE